MSRYPQSFDGDDNLYLVKDGLQTPLGIDYYPGDSNIIAEKDISNWPMSGIITLVDQCSEPLERSVSFYYGRRTNREFLEIELLPDSISSHKPKKLTNITMQVMSDHREALKDSIMSIEKFLGIKHETSASPRGETIFSRLNFLKKIIFAPKAWFEVDRVVGAVPLTVKFTFTGVGIVGPVGDVTYLWKLNDEEMQTASPNFEKVLLNPGKYTVSLTVKNYYGEDTVTFVDMIDAKGQAPEPATVQFLPLYTQNLFSDIFPKIRTPINHPINIEIPQKEMNKKTLYSGELMDSGKSIDPIVNYTWNLGDDLPHANSPKTKALFTMGGLHDLTVRTDTNLGAYRITTYKDCIDVVEPTNMWLWVKNNNNISSYEFGLVSEVLKTSSNAETIYADDSFVNSPRQKFEFWRNNGAAHQNDVKSGDGGIATVYWASGRHMDDSLAMEEIKFLKYNGFTDLYTPEKAIKRPWNWASLASNSYVYFILGTMENDHIPTMSMVNQERVDYSLSNSQSYHEFLDYQNYKNGAQELMQNTGVFDYNFNHLDAHYSVYRTAWKENTGYLLRNNGLGENLLLQSFYRTEGILGSPFQHIVKMPDMPGDDNKEGSLVTLNNGIYFFNNFGSTYCFNDTTMTWELVTPHNKLGTNELDSLLASSDKESKAYINIDGGAFFKFNEVDMSYTTFGMKTNTKQWLMTIF